LRQATVPTSDEAIQELVKFKICEVGRFAPGVQIELRRDLTFFFLTLGVDSRLTDNPYLRHFKPATLRDSANFKDEVLRHTLIASHNNLSPIGTSDHGHSLGL